jgi:predicted NAD-dependent protein-ADP-ribosyltransferase YbiA (DUF1768 family)
MARPHVFWMGPLSEYAMASFKLSKREYHSVKQFIAMAQAYHGGKLELFDLLAKSHDSYAVGRLLLDNPLRATPGWNERLPGYLVRSNLAKFECNYDIRCELYSTENYIIYANPVDTVLGIGHSPSSPFLFKKAAWRGGNLLGLALREVRDQHPMKWK